MTIGHRVLAVTLLANFVASFSAGADKIDDYVSERMQQRHTRPFARHYS
jgi:hypothetical protein